MLRIQIFHWGFLHVKLFNGMIGLQYVITFSFSKIFIEQNFLPDENEPLMPCLTKL